MEFFNNSTNDYFMFSVIFESKINKVEFFFQQTQKNNELINDVTVYSIFINSEEVYEDVYCSEIDEEKYFDFIEEEEVRKQLETLVNEIEFEDAYNIAKEELEIYLAQKKAA